MEDASRISRQDNFALKFTIGSAHHYAPEPGVACGDDLEPLLVESMSELVTYGLSMGGGGKTYCHECAVEYFSYHLDLDISRLIPNLDTSILAPHMSVR